MVEALGNMNLYESLMSKLVLFFRNEVNDPSNRGTDTTETLSPSGDTFQLSNKKLKNVYWVKDASSGEEYTQFVNFNVVFDDPSDDTDYPKITWIGSAPSSIETKYHYGQTWIYPGKPHKKFTSPRISLDYTSESDMNTGLGDWFTHDTKGYMSALLVETNFWVKDTDSFTINGNYYSGGKLNDYLADEVVDALVQKKSLLKDWNILDWRISMSRNLDFLTDENYYRKVLDLELEYQKTY